MSRTKHAKHEAAKELLMKMHRGKGESKVGGLRNSIEKLRSGHKIEGDDAVRFPTINQNSQSFHTHRGGLASKYFPEEEEGKDRL